MTRFLPATLLFFMLAAFLRAGEHEPNAEEFQALCGVAQDMDHTTIGMAYEEHFSDAIHDDLNKALKACGPRSTPPYDVALVFVIAPNGKVEHVFADPQQPVSGCLAAKLEHEKVPPPPRPPRASLDAPANPNWLLLVNFHVHQ